MYLSTLIVEFYFYDIYIFFYIAPDADYFLQGTTPCLYLETIHEETSDDLRSDSDLSDVRVSPLGWLASDSEADSVICMETSKSY